ncbi:MAG: hypothetical protein QXX48_00730, partial [Candidatus Korarchaeum sp.]
MTTLTDVGLEGVPVDFEVVPLVDTLVFVVVLLVDTFPGLLGLLDPPEGLDPPELLEELLLDPPEGLEGFTLTLSSASDVAPSISTAIDLIPRFPGLLGVYSKVPVPSKTT